MENSLVDAPLQEMPQGWQDEKRSNVLLAPFRKKEINPVDWESKMKFWQTVIARWCVEKNIANFSIKKLRTVFRRKDRPPYCLGTVLEELLRSGEVKTKAEFLSAVPYQSWSNWAVSSFVKTPVTWSVSKLWGSSPPYEDEEVEFVHMSYLKERGLQLIDATEDKEEDIITCQEAREILSKDNQISSETLDLILHWLQLEQKARVEEVHGKKLIKLVHKNKTSRVPSAISEADLAIFKVQNDINVLSKNLEHLETEKEKCVEDAKIYLQKGLRQSAKNCLRKKKKLEQCIDKRGAALDNLETLLSRLKSTDSDSKVLDAYKVGLGALKTMFKSSGLSEDNVFNTISELQEMHDMKEEIEQAISQPFISSTDNTEDLDKELADILSEAQISATFDLPDVPTSIISSPTSKPIDTDDQLLSPPM